VRVQTAVLLWLLVAVSVKLGRRHIAHNAVELMERRLAKDDFPEYYDGKTGRYIGKQSRKFQTWSVAVGHPASGVGLVFVFSSNTIQVHSRSLCPLSLHIPVGWMLPIDWFLPALPRSMFFFSG